jgi:molybdate transport system regulatory protein
LTFAKRVGRRRPTTVRCREYEVAAQAQCARLIGLISAPVLKPRGAPVEKPDPHFKGWQTMKVRTKVWIDDDYGNVVFGSGRVHMLQTIERLGSMNKAAKELHMSYRALWGRIKSTEKRLGAKVLMSKPGGSKESGSVLTPTAREFLDNYDRLHNKIRQVADEEFAKIFLTVGDREI